MRIRAERDLAAGVIYLLLGTAFLWFGKEYKLGTAARMGPGYFPFVLSWILVGFGALSVGKAFLIDGPRLGGIAWKKLSIITVAAIAFGLLINTAGLIFALPALIIIAALASEQSVYDMKGFLVLIALTAFCVLVFVKGLGVPMPIFGSWFEGIVPSSWQR